MIAFRERFSYWYVPCPIGSMYAIYGIIYHQNTPNVSIYTINGSYGCCAMVKHVKTWFFIFLVEWRTVNLWQHMATNWASKVFKFYSVFFWQHVSPFQVLVSSCITETPAYKNEPSQLIREDLVQYIKILHQRYQDCLPPEQVFCQLLSPVAVWKPRLALADGGMRHIWWGMKGLESLDAWICTW